MNIFAFLTYLTTFDLKLSGKKLSVFSQVKGRPRAQLHKERSDFSSRTEPEYCAPRQLQEG
jgi:hypothetical protein